MRISFILAVIALPISSYYCNAVNGQTPDAPPTKTSSNQVEQEKPFEKRLVDVLYRNAFSKNNLIRETSFATVLKNKKLLEQLGEGNQRELAKSGMQDENSKIVRMAFGILQKSGLDVDERQELLIGVMNSKNDWLRTAALEVLSDDRDDVLKRVIETIRNDPGGFHKNEIRLIELLGKHAGDAVPALIENFEAIKQNAKVKQAASSRSSARPLVFDYLHLVYAIAEIGPAAKDGFPIALTAAEEKSSRYARSQYAIAGAICIDRLTDGDAESMLDRFPPERLAKYELYVDTLFSNYDKDKDRQLSNVEIAQMRRPPIAADMDNNGFVTRNELVTSLASGSSAQIPLSQRTMVRDLVNAYLSQEKLRIEARDQRPNVDRQVELIFQNYDLFGPSNRLSVREVRNIDPPILISEVDQDDDQMISKEELNGYLVGQDPSDWPLAK